MVLRRLLTEVGGPSVDGLLFLDGRFLAEEVLRLVAAKVDDYLLEDDARVARL